MKNNQVYLDPNNLEASMRQLNRFYRLDKRTQEILRRIVSQYPKPVIMYVDEANAPLYAHSLLDDLFTFNTETGELVLFSSDPITFVDALIEMWMYVEGFETMLGDDDYWKVEFAIGAWKTVRDNIKRQLDIPVNSDINGIVGLPPDPDEAPLEDPYPFKTLVSTLNTVSFAQMIRLAGRPEIRVHFPEETDEKVKEVYFTMRRTMKLVGHDMSIGTVEDFNRRLRARIKRLESRYQPKELPMPEGWDSSDDGHEAASGAEGKPGDNDEERGTTLLLGPPDDEPEFGRLLGAGDFPTEEYELDKRLEDGPFGRFIETLFDD